MARAISLSPRGVWPIPRPTEWPELAGLGEWLRFGTDPIRIEEFVENDALVVRAELPGVDPDTDIELSLAGGLLHISAHREERLEDKSKPHFHSEFHYGSFSRTIPLPVGSFESEVKASYDNGVLEIRVPLMTAPTHRIPIQHH